MDREKLASPCISICQINPENGECSGCYRTRDEIAKWRSMDYEAQAGLLAELSIRREAVTGVARRKTRRKSLKSLRQSA